MTTDTPAELADARAQKPDLWQPTAFDRQHMANALLEQLQQNDEQWIAVRVRGTGWEIVRPRSQEAIVAALDTTEPADLVKDLERLAAKATPGAWGVDTLKSEGEYGSGPDTSVGFEVSAIYDASGLALFDALNSDAITVQEDYPDEDGYVLAYDEVSAANAALIVTLRNNLPAILTALSHPPREEALREALVQHNDRLRSAAAIAARDGADTNWQTFRGQVHYTLAEYHDLVNEARAALTTSGEG